MRDKSEAKRQVIKLLFNRMKNEYQIKKIVWDCMMPGKEMPDLFPYKKWIREEFGLIV